MIRASVERWLPVLLLAALFAALTIWSWGKWSDPQIDFGNELYTAWQIGEGRLLYAEMAYRNGPLSHHLNALWFALFGVSVRTLVWCNLAIFAAIVAMTYRVVAPSCGRLSATVACAFLLVVCGFSQYSDVANYNFVTPYQHSQTHGLALCLALLLLLLAAQRRSHPAWCAGAGLCLGLVFLGKVELFVPAAALAVAGLGVIALARRSEGRSSGTPILAFSVGASIPVIGALLLLGSVMPWQTAWLGVRGNWAYLGHGLLRDSFYLEGSGFDRGAAGVAEMLAMSALVLVFILVVAVADRWLPALRRRAWACALLGIALFALLAWRLEGASWLALPRALPVTTLAMGAVLWVPRLRRAVGVEAWLPLALWSVFALLLLGKMLLKARLVHYGFVLAAPAAVLLVAALVGLLPAALARRHGGGELARAASIAVIAAMAFAYWSASDRMYAVKSFGTGAGADRLSFFGPPADIRAASLDRALKILDGNMAPSHTLLVLPEGIGMNYWLRRVNPTPYHLFLPTEIEAFGGEAAVLDEIAAQPPDFVVLAKRGYEEFGVGPFGRDPDYGQMTVRWVQEHYESIARIGAPPIEADRFGIAIYRRKGLRR